MSNATAVHYLKPRFLILICKGMLDSMRKHMSYSSFWSTWKTTASCFSYYFFNWSNSWWPEKVSALLIVVVKWCCVKQLCSVLHVCLFSQENTHLKADIRTTRLRLKSAVLWETNARIIQMFPVEQFSQDDSLTCKNKITVFLWRFRCLLPKHYEVP